MVGIILAGHGGFAEGLLDAARLIMGPQEKVVPLALAPEEDPGVFAERLEAALAELGTPEALLLVDLYGGSPANAGAVVWRRRRGLGVVAGVNLPLLLEVLAARERCGAGELVEIALQAGREGLRDVVVAIQAVMKTGEGCESEKCR